MLHVIYIYINQTHNNMSYADFNQFGLYVCE